MNSLHKQCILLLNPNLSGTKGYEANISPQEIREYQGIEENELYEAIHIVKDHQFSVRILFSGFEFMLTRDTKLRNSIRCCTFLCKHFHRYV